MATRELWSGGGEQPALDLLASGLAALLLQRSEDGAAYFASPYMSDFVLLSNALGQWTDLMPGFADQTEIWFSNYLGELSKIRDVRVIAVRHDSSDAFVAKLLALDAPRLRVRGAPDNFHAKGILCPHFYLEGSMNLTFSGVRINQEKLVFHVPDDEQGRTRLSVAYLEHDRLWSTLRHAR